MRRSLVIGASGLVGEHLARSLFETGEKPVLTFRTDSIPAAEQLDICRAEDVSALFKRVQPEVVFLPAALTNVDYCETHQELSYRTNVIGVKNVVEASNQMAARLIYFSTDYVFDGASGPYVEESAANPISVYGLQKLIAEHYIALTCLNYLIIRTTVVYGWERRGKNFIYRLVRSLREGSALKVPDDQIGTPTYAAELAQSAIQLSATELQGVVNIAGSNCISRYEFALQAAGVFDLPAQLIERVSTTELNQPAKRPLQAGLKTERARTLLGTTFLSTSDGLRIMARQKDRAAS